MFKVSAVLPRRSAVLKFSVVLRRSMTEPLRYHGDHGGATAVYAVQTPQWHRDSGVTRVLGTGESSLVTGSDAMSVIISDKEAR